MDTFNLRALVAVIDRRSVSEAAPQLSMSRAGVSMLLHRLESQYRVKLVQRRAGGIAPTAAGMALYRYATEVLRLEGLLGQQLERERARTEGWVGLGALPSITRYLLLNPIAALLAQDKALMAWIWERRQTTLFPPDEQAAIALHLPETYLIGEAPADLERTAFVLKEFFGREGEEVYFGDAVSDADWERCRVWRTFVAQRVVESQRVEDALWHGERAERAWRVPCVGSYLAGDRWAGLYVRLGDRVTTNRAQHVAALVERGNRPLDEAKIDEVRS